MRQFTDAELKVLIRAAAMNRWINGDDSDWIDIRMQTDRWSEGDTTDFLDYYAVQIKRARHQIDSWMDAKDEFV